MADWQQWIARDIDTAAPGPGGRVLLVAYMFPPVGGSAVHRPAKLTQYLGRFGWQVEVLTAGHDRFGWHDASLSDYLPSQVQVHRVAGYEPACLARRATLPVRWMDVLGNHLGQHVEDAVHWRLSKLLDRFARLNDAQSLWVAPAIRWAVHRYSQPRRELDAVITSGPPHFVHAIGRTLAQQLDIAWVADLRDPLISDFDRQTQDENRVEQLLELEETILSHADRVVTTCAELADDLCERYPTRPVESVLSITNGFDRRDIQLAMRDGLQRETGKCTFVIAGAMYGRRELLRIVEPLQRVLQEHPQWVSRVELVIAGVLDRQQQQYWQEHSPPWVKLVGYLDHASAIRLVACGSCAIVIVPDCQHGRMSIPGKAYELLALPTHMLLLAPGDSATDRLIGKFDAVTAVPLEQPDRVADAMSDIIAQQLAGVLPDQRNWAEVDVYDRVAVAEQFARCLVDATGQVVRIGPRRQACQEVLA